MQKHFLKFGKVFTNVVCTSLILISNNSELAAKYLPSEDDQSIKKFKDLYKDENNVPRPDHWSGWRLKHHEIEFWLDGENRIHERLKYIKDNNIWKKVLLSP